MSTHDFEKQVQQKMDELRFNPSEAVWDEVEKQIRERKERRRLLVWWWTLPFLVAGSIGVYSIFPKKHERPGGRTGVVTVAPGMTNNGVTNNKTNNNTNEQPPAKNGQEPVAGGGRPGDVAVTTTAPATTMATTPANSNGQQLHAINGHSTGFTDMVAGHAVTKEKKNMQMPVMPVTTGDVVIAEPVQPEGGGVVTAEEEKAALKRSWPQAMGLPLIAVRPSAEKVFAAAAADSAAQKAKHPDTKKKMEWVGTLQAGVTGISSGLFSIPQSTSAYDQSSNASFSSPINGNGGTTGQPTVSGSPSNVKPGFAFSGGLSLRRYMSDVFSLEAGLRYSYSSTSIQVGQKRDNTAAIQLALPAPAYYTNTLAATRTGYTYTNQYHFIEIPLRAQLLCGPQSPLSFNTGLSIGRLLASNALQYDASNNVYYKDNSFFNKTQLTLSAGADIRLWRKKAMPVEIGPRLQYGLTNLFKENIYGSRHLLFAGMEVRLSFPKK